MSAERFKIERRYVADGGWRWVIARVSDDQVLQDSASREELVRVLEQAGFTDDLLADTRAKSMPIREGFREDHWQAVKRARNWAA